MLAIVISLPIIVTAQWIQLGNDIEGEAAGDYSGYSVAFSSDGSRVAVGAIANEASAGHVRVYDYTGGSWSQVGADIDGEAANDRTFG